MTDIPLESLPYLPVLTRFAVALAEFLFVPKLCARIGLPSAVGLLIAGVLLGPSGLRVAPQKSQIAEFFAEIGKLLLSSARRNRPAELLAGKAGMFVLCIWKSVTS